MKREKIALINPPSPFLIDERVFPNIGLIRVATVLKLAKYDIKVFDFAGDKDYINNIKKIAHKYDYYMFSSTTPQFPYTYKLFKSLKEEDSLAKTIIGGAHASAISSIRRKGIEDINIKPLEEFIEKELL